MKVALAKQMHEIDDAAVNDFGLPELALMESAGHRVAQVRKKFCAARIKNHFASWQAVEIMAAMRWRRQDICRTWARE